MTFTSEHFTGHQWLRHGVHQLRSARRQLCHTLCLIKHLTSSASLINASNDGLDKTCKHSEFSFSWVSNCVRFRINVSRVALRAKFLILSYIYTWGVTCRRSDSAVDYARFSKLIMEILKLCSDSTSAQHSDRVDVHSGGYPARSSCVDHLPELVWFTVDRGVHAEINLAELCFFPFFLITTLVLLLLLFDSVPRVNTLYNVQTL